MGKRAASKAKAKATPKAAVAAADAGPQSVFEQADQSQRQTARRRLQRRQTDDKVDRISSDKFAFLPIITRENSTIRGKTLRQTLTEEVRALSPNERLSSRRVGELQAEWSMGDDVMARLVVADGNSDVSATLIQALEHAQNPNPAVRTVEPVVAWLGQTATINQKEFIGLLRVCCSPERVGRPVYDRILLECMKCVVRLVQQQIFIAELAVVNKVFDNVMTRHFQAMKRSGVSAATYCQVHLNLVHLLINSQDLSQVMTADT